MRKTVVILMLVSAGIASCAKKAQPPVAQGPPALQPVERLEPIEPVAIGPPGPRPLAPEPVAPEPVPAVPVKGTADQAEAPPEITTKPAQLVTHTIAKNDTLWSLARRYLGDPKRWPEIQKANPGLEPRKLQVGQTIKIPVE